MRRPLDGPVVRSGSERVVLVVLLWAVFALRAWNAGQPIVENYVGRQIPTAMVARNFDRGSGFLHPQLDTAPFPSYFLVEPPIYQFLVVGLSRRTGLGLEAAGRVTSALATTLAALGLFVLARPREGPVVSLLAVAALGLLPVTIRYGRAFQPDALMLGLSVAGLAAWDQAQRADRRSGRAGWSLVGGLSLSIGWATKAIAAHLLLPLVLGVAPRPARWKIAIATALMLVPVIAWYAHAAELMREGARASAQNLAIWRDVLRGSLSLEWIDLQGLTSAGRWLVRAFSPLGLILSLWGWWSSGRQQDRLWLWWWLALAATAAALARKMHHEYYGLMFAPVIAVGVGRSLVHLSERGRSRAWFAWSVGLTAVVLALWQVSATWRVPEEWTGLNAAADEIRWQVNPDEWVVAPEALLYQADRRGCRVEWSPEARLRAAREWMASEREIEVAVREPLGLIEFYRGRGARWFAELPGRLPPGLARELSAHYRVVVDRPEVFLVELTPLRGDHHDGRR